MDLTDSNTTDNADNATVVLVNKDTSTETGTSSNPIRINPTGTTAQPVTDNGGSLTVDGAVSVNNASGAAAVNIQDGGNSITVDGSISVSNFPATQNVAITSSVEIEVKNDTGNPIPVNGTVAATQSGTWNINNISGTVSLPTGASTSALQTTGNTSLSSIDGKLNSLGQKTMANSVPVVISSDQSAVPASQSGTWNINNVSGTVSLPTGAATSANQTTEITSLQIIDDVPTSQNGTFVKGTPIMGQLDDTSTTAATEDAIAAARITAQRALHVNLRNNSGTEIGTTGNPVNVNVTGITITQGPTPTITRKARSILNTSAITAPAAYATMYTRSGSGIFFGFQADFNSANVSVKLTLDSDVIFEHAISDLKLLQFNDTTTTRFQAGGWWGTVGNTIDFSPKLGIPYATTVLIEIKRTDATNHTNNNYIVFLTQET